MKRLFQVLGTLILLVVAAAVILPAIFKDEIISRAKDEMNKYLTATVDFKDIDISLFRSFPDFALTLEETTVDGKGIFEGTRLADIGSVNVNLNLFSVISGNSYEIEGIQIKDATVHVVVDTSGVANYDIVNFKKKIPKNLKEIELGNIETLIKEKEEVWIYFIKASMSEETRDFNFGKGVFLIEKAKVVEREISIQLEENLLTFSFGKYAFMETEKYLIVKVTS